MRLTIEVALALASLMMRASSLLLSIIDWAKANALTSIALAAGAVLLSSRYPLDRIWETSQPGAAKETVDLNSGASHLLVLRRADDATFVSLDAGEAAFVAMLAEGMSLERAAGAAFQIDPAFELSTSFARLLALGAFAALQ